MKLDPWNIEIYAGIDAYARYVPWAFVGVSATTQVSVLYQYRTCLEAIGRMPNILRSDHGGETPMIADLHLALRRKEEPDIQLDDVYVYGSSTKNQRIESFWGQLTSSQENPWIVYYPP